MQTSRRPALVFLASFAATLALLSLAATVRWLSHEASTHAGRRDSPWGSVPGPQPAALAPTTRPAVPTDRAVALPLAQRTPSVASQAPVVITSRKQDTSNDGGIAEQSTLSRPHSRPDKSAGSLQRNSQLSSVQLAANSSGFCSFQKANFLNRYLRNDQASVWFRKVLCSQQENSVLQPVVYLDDEISSGIGSRLMRQVVAAFYSFASNKRLLNNRHGSWIYTSQARCEKTGKQNDCFFQPTSPVSADDPTMPGCHRRCDTSPRQVLLSDGKTVRAERWTRASLDVKPPSMRRSARPMVAGSRYSGCWVTAQLLHFLVQPSAQLEAELQAVKTSIGFSLPCTAVHVRRGDRAERMAKAGKKPTSLEDIMAAVAKTSANPNLVLMTEDESVASELAASWPQYRLLYSKYSRNRTLPDVPEVGAIAGGILRGYVDGSKETMHSLINLYMAAECDAFVGGFRSSWGMLVLMMQYVTHGRFAPHHGLGTVYGVKWGFGMCTRQEFEAEMGPPPNRASRTSNKSSSPTSKSSKKTNKP